MASSGAGENTEVTLLQHFKGLNDDTDTEKMIKWYVKAFNNFTNSFLQKINVQDKKANFKRNLKEYILKEYIHDVRESATKGVKEHGERGDALAFLTKVSTSNPNEHVYVSNTLTNYGMNIYEYNLPTEENSKIDIEPLPSTFSQIHSDAGKHKVFNNINTEKLFQNPLDGSTVGSNLLYGTLIVFLLKDLVGSLITSSIDDDASKINRFKMTYHGFQKDKSRFGFEGHIISTEKVIEINDGDKTTQVEIRTQNKFNSVIIGTTERLLLITQFIEKEDGEWKVTKTIPVAFDSNTLKISLTILLNQIIDSVINSDLLAVDEADTQPSHILINQSIQKRKEIQSNLISFENSRNENAKNKDFNGFFNYISEYITTSIKIGYYSLPKWVGSEALNKGIMTYWLTKGFGDAGYSFVDLLNQFGNDRDIGDSIGFTGDQQCYIVSVILSDFLNKKPIQSIYVIKQKKNGKSWYNIKVRSNSKVKITVNGTASIPDDVRKFNEGFYDEKERNYGFITSRFFTKYYNDFLNNLSPLLRPRFINSFSFESIYASRSMQNLPTYIRRFNDILLNQNEGKFNFETHFDIIKVTYSDNTNYAIKAIIDKLHEFVEKLDKHGSSIEKSEIDKIKLIKTSFETLLKKLQPDQTGSGGIFSMPSVTSEKPILLYKNITEEYGEGERLKELYNEMLLTEKERNSILPETQFKPENLEENIQNITNDYYKSVDYLNLEEAADPGRDDSAAGGGGGSWFFS